MVRRLAILRDEMGGGATWTIDIGDSKLQYGDIRTETSWLNEARPRIRLGEIDGVTHSNYGN